MLCADIIAILLTVHTSFGYGVIFSFFSFRSILDESYGFDDLETSLAYLRLLVGYGLAIVIHGLMERRTAGILIGWCIPVVSVAYISRSYDFEILSSAIAANGVVRYSSGATFPLFTIEKYDTIGAGWASGAFAFLSLFLIPSL
ncbi:hypothetical protein BJX66DRAFT_345594 [Aspergillus keveii]|uniref:MFS transporter n=1 Tax=Aspergillus keveii TaxID=714993 RepID=A0ABR4FHI4_9EURO